MKKIVKVGSRQSQLALVQTKLIISQLKEHFPQWDFELITVKTTGDKFLNSNMYELGKGAFVKEIEEALLYGAIDMAVHSLKDVPQDLPEGLEISAITRREDPRDVFISADGRRFSELDTGAKIGTSSMRRICELNKLRQDIQCVQIRGNINTRIKKIKTCGLDGIVLAAAGVKRLGMENLITDYFSPDEIVPAVGQGALAVETRADDEMSLFVRHINDDETTCATRAERAFMKVLGGSCKQPMGAYAEIFDDRLKLIGMIERDKIVKRGKLEGRRSEAEQIGIRLAEELGGKL
ncbi:porphobilinogen deaminase [Tepidanaerobacter syntrophicus]|uniref:Porphobilinogen deaminase n=1 Tax=Tepidanaerobacter syntrophicus TaxID=224999 RepID=A0A0U9HEV0_9FIRM|nr:hydroxymethylbilane synthase [Tepidanaerobacter syntrophicus]GAQ25317.1 hydroxymethylbilane synthase [Tepidanaerobacter syntrophicus]GLI18788.1 porphobilinogen deaminase [Tepidanaerobacter syntrophicus]GLI50864.1 porphobilinogen deaminase [Tepidanaerobacter syntrophicus]